MPCCVHHALGSRDEAAHDGLTILFHDREPARITSGMPPPPPNGVEQPDAQRRRTTRNAESLQADAVNQWSRGRSTSMARCNNP
ncbi:uncharacterized protein THITE_2113889 [Thermothielavioides terrestris NRRL 8126]|uniref:Uncharacterized protein n=1 Tax=Thermothielavioides terrestris (strain ATCC 38088 / NRRL 8126) TaxID=578455 RepID=G2R4N6_THETT|nr:uncharacterized protein THITE_2113889 [Thermothielavioides terrestris NRRL 8126]AEO66076.1 hypothetical protein THITE_2113889 [Thermothielavioides terrestris NRRL 8126]